jgi:hypothetical protein
MDGSNCSALKGSGSNQDPKRTDGSSGAAFDSSAGHVTPFEESLRSTIKDQEASRERPRAAKNTATKSDTAQRVDNQPQKLNAAPARQRQPTDKTKAAASATDDSRQTQQPKAAVNTDVADPALESAVLVNALPVNNVAAVNLPPMSDAAAVAAVSTGSTSQAFTSVAGSNQVKLDSETKASADQDTLVLDATLHSAAPVPARPPKASLAGAGKPAWLLNSQPVYAARENSSNVADSNQLPALNIDDQNNQAASTTSGTPQQPAPQNIMIASAQSFDKAVASSTQSKPDVHPAQTNHTQAVPPQQSGQTNMDQSPSDNTPGFEKDPKQAAPEPGVNHQPEPAAQAPHVLQASDSPAAKVDSAPSSNNGPQISSKSGVLPINQQADIRQPSMKTDLNMRIQGQSGESINVRISERAGDIQISVRSSDQGTANVLKHELPSIEAGLERAGWRMESSGMSQPGQDQHEAGRDSQNPDRNRGQNSQQPNWQDRNQRRRDSSPNPWFEMDGKTA